MIQQKERKKKYHWNIDRLATTRPSLFPSFNIYRFLSVHPPIYHALNASRHAPTTVPIPAPLHPIARQHPRHVHHHLPNLPPALGPHEAEGLLNIYMYICTKTNQRQDSVDGESPKSIYSMHKYYIYLQVL